MKIKFLLSIAVLMTINFSVSAQSSLSGIPTQNLVSWYPFNSNAEDGSGNGLHGYVNGAKLTTDRFGKSNSAYSFATNQEIVIPNSQNLNVYPLTISLWYNLDSLRGGEGSNIFSKYVPAAWNGIQLLTADFRNIENNGEILNNGFGVSPWYLRNGNDRLIGYYGEPPFLQKNISAKTWYHFVFVVDETGGKIFVNGNLIDTHPWTGNPGASTNCYLWKIGGLYSQWFHGKIDDVGIWNRALSESEIRQLYSAFQCNTFPPTGSADQTFCLGATVSDLKASGNNIKWYSTITGGLALQGNTMLTNGSVFYASQTVNGCESESRLAVKVSVVYTNCHKVYFADQTIKTGSTVEVIIYTNNLTSSDGIISYQFNFNYDTTKLDYLGKSITGTLAEGGNVLVNNSGNGLLRISYMNQNLITGAGAILKLTFKVLASGTISSTITDFLFNSDSVNNILNGLIYSVLRYGDVDDNGIVQAFDAALALQYSAGFDPLLSVDPLPWEKWRFQVSNVDAIGDITAYDAALILQYSAGLINIFPVEGRTKSAGDNIADIKVSIIDNEMYFSATGNLYGLNLNCNACSDVVGQPVFLNNNFLTAVNITEDSYRIALATTVAPKQDEPFMKIPIFNYDTITLFLTINDQIKIMPLNLKVTGINDMIKGQIKIYPNPATSRLMIEFEPQVIEGEFLMDITNMLGQVIHKTPVNQMKYDLNISDLKTKGLHLVRIYDNKGNCYKTEKVIVQ